MRVYIALGGNQNATCMGHESEGHEYEGHKTPPASTFVNAVNVLTHKGVKIQAKSSLWQSPAWPAPQLQPPYINAVISAKTQHSPLQLLKILKQTECLFGRKPSARNAARPLDLDILDYKGQVLNHSALTLPHPRMLGRGFVLFPLQEIAPYWRDPIGNSLIADLTARLAYQDVQPLKLIKRVW